jgi:hypothetical protein
MHIITASFCGRLSERREERIHEALAPFSHTSYYGFVSISNVCWDEDDGRIIIEIALKNDEQADRCASAMRCCGAMVSKIKMKEEGP